MSGQAYISKPAVGGALPGVCSKLIHEAVTLQGQALPSLLEEVTLHSTQDFFLICILDGVKGAYLPFADTLCCTL